MNRKTVLLIGCTGQIGNNLYQLMMPMYNVINPTRFQLDLSKPKALRKKIKDWNPDLIINAAAYTQVDKAENNAELVFLINTEAPIAIAQVANELNIPLIHYSTDYVFNGKKSCAYLENDNPDPINVYGESKLQSEEGVFQYNDKSLVLRTSWIYGNNGSNFLTIMKSLFRSKDEINVVNDQFGSPTWSYEVARATLKLITNIDKGSKNLWGLYHMTTSGSTTWHGFANEIQNKDDFNSITKVSPISSKDYKSIAKRPKNTVLNNDKLLTDWDIKLPHWKDALERCILENK